MALEGKAVLPVLNTIGYEKASLEDFIATLHMAGVSIVVDVRELPISRRKGFSKRALHQALEAEGIGYVHFVTLGDPKDGRVAAKEGRIDQFQTIFSRHLRTPSAQEALLDVIKIIRSGCACLLCYERDHRVCHRKLISDAVSSMINVSVCHLGVRDGSARDARKTRAGARFDSRESATSCW